MPNRPALGLLVLTFALSCAEPPPAGSDAPAVETLRQAAGSSSVTITFDGGVAALGCPRCGGDWACNGIGNWSDGRRTFVDPAPPGTHITQVNVTITYMSARISTQVLLNGFSYDLWSDLSQFFSCSGTACLTHTTTVTPSPYVIPGWVRGGVNEVWLLASGAPQPESFCVRSVTVTVHWTESTLPLVSPASLTFAPQPVGTTSAPQSVVLTNPGPYPTHLLSASTTGPYGTNPTALVMQPDASVSLDVWYRPTATGSQSGSLALTTAAGPLSVPLFGTARFGQLTATPNPVAFPDTALNTTATEPWSLRNTGDWELQILSFSLFDAGFALGLPPLPITLQPQQVLMPTASFRPGRRGVHAATATFVLDGGLPPSTVSFSGNGVGAEVLVTDAGAAFGDVRVATTARHTVGLWNVGEAPLSITALSVTGTAAANYAVVPIALPVTVQPGAVQPLSIDFTPSVRGVRQANLVITSNGAGTGAPLAGRGVGPSLSTPLPTTWNAPVGGSVDVGVTLRNDGELPAILSGATLVTGTHFAVDAGFPITIPPLASGTVGMRFAPLAPGTLTDTLRVAYDAPGIYSTTVRGNGSGPGASFAPADVDAGVTTPGSLVTRTVVLTNTGNQTLTVTGATIFGGDAAQFGYASATSFTVAAGATRNLLLRYQPTEVGAHAATLELASAPIPARLPLCGRAETGSLVAPATHDVGLVRPGVPRTSTLTVSNGGAWPLRLLSAQLGVPDGGVFAVTASLPRTIPVGQSYALGVTANVVAPGPVTDTLTLLGDAFDAGPTVVQLLATGTDRFLSASPSMLDFGSVPVGGQSQQRLRVNNLSAEPVAVTAISGAAPPFSISVSAGLAVPAGGFRELDVTFQPTDGGPHSAELGFFVADAGVADLRVSLAGFGGTSSGTGGGAGGGSAGGGGGATGGGATGGGATGGGDATGGGGGESGGSGGGAQGAAGGAATGGGGELSSGGCGCGSAGGLGPFLLLIAWFAARGGRSGGTLPRSARARGGAR